MMSQKRLSSRAVHGLGHGLGAVVVFSLLAGLPACGSASIPGAEGGSPSSGGSSAGGGSASAGAPPEGGVPGDETPTAAEIRRRLQALVLPKEPSYPADPTNAYAENLIARDLGKKFFYDPRFSGPLLAHDNTGGPGTVGEYGETGKVSCVSCHVPESGYVDSRSNRGQLSLASGWTRRRTPTVLDAAQVKLTTWGGRRDTAYAVVFGVIESPLEFNSSRLFVAQQIAKAYGPDYEEVFGPLPDLSAFSPLTAVESGCDLMPEDPLHTVCAKPGSDDEAVTRVVVNFGKAIASYMRMLTCGRSRFDEWMDGDTTALTPEEQAGAELFVGRGQCSTCHSGPYFSDQKFHNVGVPGQLLPFTGIDTGGDRGAILDLATMLQDPLNSRGIYSDGDDGRLDLLPKDLSTMDGAFRTPMLRCAGRRPSYFHNGDSRSLYDVVQHFINGGSSTLGVVGNSELKPLDLDLTDRDHLVAFLKALDGPGPSMSILMPPEIPDVPVDEPTE
jgi:cytochrome c peroxidase